MTALALVAVMTAQTPSPIHPLDPLSAAEIGVATDTLTKAGRMTPSVRVVTIELSEPAKRSGRQPAVPRAARAVLFDWSGLTTSEVLVDLARRTIASSSVVATGDAPIRRMMIARATEAALGDQRVVDALRRRGITALDRINFLGGFGEGVRMARRGGTMPVLVAPWVWDPIGEGGLVPGFSVRVDLMAGRVEDIGDAAPPTNAGGAARPPAVPPGRALQPLVVTQPNGPSFRIEGSEILWDRWRLHFDVHPRRGLEVFDVAIMEGTRARSVLYRGSLSELITPYGDPAFGSWFPRDAGDYGLTTYSGARASAIVASDAPANAVFAPGVFADERGGVLRVPRAVAIYERDGGVLWRHAGPGQRARQLVLTGYATLDNYDYLISWIFGQDGAIDVQVQLTGLLNVRRLLPSDASHAAMSDDTTFAHLVAPGVMAPNHEHFFCFRLDLDVDGVSNRVVELNTSNAQAQLRDNVGEWFGMQSRALKTELDARREINFATARRWVVTSSERTNALGGPTGYALVPGENAPPFQAPDSAPRRRAAFLDHHLWVTLFDPQQMYASGEWVNLLREREGVAAWSAGDRPVVDRDVVLWYTFAVTHLPRPEDWPVMPAYTAGFRLAPLGFFAENPTAPR